MVKNIVKFLIGFIVLLTVLVVGFCVYVINADNSSIPMISMLNSLVGDAGLFTTLSNVGSVMGKVDADTISSITAIAQDTQKVNEITSAIQNIDPATLVEVSNIIKDIDPEIVTEFKEIINNVDITSISNATDVNQVLEVVDLATIVEITDLVGELDTTTKDSLQQQIDTVIGDADVSSLVAKFLK